MEHPRYVSEDMPQNQQVRVLAEIFSAEVLKRALVIQGYALDEGTPCPSCVKKDCPICQGKGLAQA